MKTNSSTLTALCCGILATLGCATQLYAADANPGPTVMCSNVPPAECGEPVVTGATVQDVSGSPLTVQWVASGVLTQMVSLAGRYGYKPDYPLPYQHLSGRHQHPRRDGQ